LKEFLRAMDIKYWEVTFNKQTGKFEMGKPVKK
jgi:hypothetical protein